MRFLAAFVLSVMMMAGAQATIPPGAVKGADGSYRFTDSAGHKWIYRATPFGVARVADVPAPAAPEVDEKAIADVRAFPQGDRVRFERPGPFGTYKWERPMNGLNAQERAVLAREKARTQKQD